MQKRAAMIAMLWLMSMTMGCSDSFKSSIPSVSFQFSCSLAQSPYYLITTPGQFLKVEKNINGLPVGYAGLIIGQSVFSEGADYTAFDAACPVEVSRSVSVELISDGLGTARCPECNTEYNLSSGGLPKEGEGTERLKPYKVVMAGTTLQVRN